MKFSYGAVWEDAVRMLRANASLLTAVAGAFLFLPSLMLGYLAPPPQGAEGSLEPMLAHVRDNAFLFVLVNTIGFVGSLAILTLVLDPARPTVGGAIRTALALVAPYFVISFLAGSLITFGLLAFLLPGIYAIGRFAAAAPVLVAERTGIVATIKRSLEVTKGKGWAIAGLILVAILLFVIVSIALTGVFGSVFLLLGVALGQQSLGALLVLILEAAIGAAFNAILFVLFAAIYRRLTGATAPTNGI